MATDSPTFGWSRQCSRPPRCYTVIHVKEVENKEERMVEGEIEWNMSRERERMMIEKKRKTGTERP